ncbi:unnamed protein product [Caenorhabditis angaria]|uniref:Uncharacterized protein n=1 Tax=Caenorhabditis angaria TaxID=860376 RepID=A0A9P1N4H5_9PELO|nr:unnamed protein product [Caenorhabditis angaria]
MAYIDKSGNLCEGSKQKGIIELILSFFACIWLFFSSMFGGSSNQYRPTNQDYRQVVRGNGNAGGDGSTNYRPGGIGGGGDGMRRNIGRLAPVSGTAPPPMGGGCCGGGGCG